MPETRLIVELKAAAYKDGISKGYNKRVLERWLDVGHLVHRRTTATSKAHAEGKLAANCEGLYIIAMKLAPGSFILKGIGDKELRNCWNASVLKKYYV